MSSAAYLRHICGKYCEIHNTFQTRYYYRKQQDSLWSVLQTWNQPKSTRNEWVFMISVLSGAKKRLFRKFLRFFRNFLCHHFWQKLWGTTGAIVALRIVAGCNKHSFQAADEQMCQRKQASLLDKTWHRHFKLQCSSQLCILSWRPFGPSITPCFIQSLRAQNMYK